MKNLLKTHRRVSVLFYILASYVIIQFAWWAYLLIDLSEKYYAREGAETVRLKIWMVAGEGTVFLIFLLTGIYIMQRTINKEIGLVKQQRNFLLSITHELKTPLSAIKLALQTLQKRDELNTQQRHRLETGALSNTERLHSLIDNVLLATRIESGKHPLDIAPTDLSALTGTTAEESSHWRPKEQQLELYIEKEIRANVDSRAYASIVVNLLENAFKYGMGKPVRLSLKKEAGLAVLEVADSGPGIPNKDRRRVFEKFYRVGNEETRSKKGTGLGLYIAKELTELHGGHVSVSSPNGGGSVFRVIIPR